MRIILKLRYLTGYGLLVQLGSRADNHGEKRKMTKDQLENVVCRIVCNETRLICELSDHEIEGYLVDAGIEETDENIKSVRNS